MLESTSNCKQLLLSSENESVTEFVSYVDTYRMSPNFKRRRGKVQR